MQLTSIIDSEGKTNKFSLFLGSYDTFLSFFALSQLPNSDKNFLGLPDYGSTIAFELISYSDDVILPKDGNGLYVRFLFRNGTDAATPLREYPIFGHASADAVMLWADFRDAMAGVSVSSVSQWCGLCEATESFCPIPAKSGITDVQNPQKKKTLSPSVAGVIGAICALAVVGVAMAFAMVFFGVRFAKSWRNTKEGGFNNGGKLASAYDLQTRSSTDKSSVQHPNKTFAQ